MSSPNARLQQFEIPETGHIPDRSMANSSETSRNTATSANIDAAGSALRDLKPSLGSLSDYTGDSVTREGARVSRVFIHAGEEEDATAEAERSSSARLCRILGSGRT